jgi:hypothetical protein
MARAVVRSKFESHEDDLLTDAVRMYGTSNWSIVAMALPGRNSRQCRDRWNNYLRPNLKTNEWTPEEEAQLVERVQAMGSRWERIATFFRGRSKNSLRSRFMTIQRRNARAMEASRAAGVSNPIQDDVATIPLQAVAQVANKDPLAFMDRFDESCSLFWESSIPPYLFPF